MEYLKLNDDEKENISSSLYDIDDKYYKNMRNSARTLRDTVALFSDSWAIDDIFIYIYNTDDVKSKNVPDWLKGIGGIY